MKRESLSTQTIMAHNILVTPYLHSLYVLLALFNTIVAISRGEKRRLVFRKWWLKLSRLGYNPVVFGKHLTREDCPFCFEAGVL